MGMSRREKREGQGAIRAGMGKKGRAQSASTDKKPVSVTPSCREKKSLAATHRGLLSVKRGKPIAPSTRERNNGFRRRGKGKVALSLSSS